MNKKILMAMLMAISIALYGCGNDTSSVVNTSKVGEGPFGKYDPPITVTAARVVLPFVKFPEGDSIENNIWTRAYEEQLGIKIKYLWTVSGYGEPFDQKINIALASDDLPDIIPLYTTLFMKAKDAGKLQDLTEAYNTYASDRLRNIMESMDSAAIKGSTFDGKMLAIGQTASLPEGPRVWIRDDWMKKLSLSPPENIDDVIEIARTFTREDASGTGKTVGMAVSENLNVDLVDFFYAFDTQPGAWITKDGKFVYGSAQEEIKTPLKVLAELFEEGVIDREFAMKRSDAEVKNDIIAGKVGVVFSSTSGPGTALGDAHRNDGSDWNCYPLYTSQGTPARSVYSSTVTGFMSVSEKCEYPEVAVKLINFALETLDGKPDWVKDNSFHTSPEGYLAFFYPLLKIDDPYFNLNAYAQVQNALSTGDVSQMNIQVKTYYDEVKKHMENPSADTWGTYKGWGPEGIVGMQKEYIDNKEYIESKAVITETPTWLESGQNLSGKVKEFFTKAIMNGNVDEEYAIYVDYFNAQGGKKATDEINELNAGYLP